MWILSYFPDFVTHIIFVVGVIGTIAGFVLGFVPFIATYRLPIQIISILVLSFGLYLEGGLAEQAVWELKVKEMEAKVAEAQEQSKEETVKIETKVINKTQVIRERGDEILKYIDREIVKYDTTCIIPKEFIEAHNKAAEKLK